MRYKSGAAFRQALEQRLLARSRETGTSLVRLRKAVVFDRLLARLMVAAPGRWVLKGALALDFRLGERTRTTKDMDLVRNDNETAATSDEVPVLPLEQHIAEKVHAYTRTYPRGRGSSRAKDLVDIVLVKQSMALDAARLRLALVGVFEKRRQHRLPDRFPPPPPDWVVPYRKMGTEVGVNSDLRTGYAEAAALLDPILGGRADGRWNPKDARWR